MVNLKKQITIILIISFSLSLIPNFLYNEGEWISATEVSCPSGCDPIEKNGETSCINCPIKCQWGGGNFENKTCRPLEGAGEWACGIEIPIGEAMDRTFLLSSKMANAFEAIVDSANLMVEKTDEILNSIEEWSCEDTCSTGCFKYYHIIDGVLVTDSPQPVGCTPTKSYSRNVSEECQNCTGPVSCQTECAYDKCPDGCCYADLSQTDPLTDELITCRYCPGQYEGRCVRRSCGGCCDQYFSPIIDAYSNIEILQKDLEETIKEKNQPEKFKRDYIIEQLNYSRCELSKCWIPAEDLPEVLTGDKVGKHLLTCETVSQMGLLDDDQIECGTTQAEEEEKEVEGFWQGFWEQIKTKWREWIWDPIKNWFETITEWLTGAEEEGCYPSNYYCCQF